MAAVNTSASYAVTIRVELPSAPGSFARLAAAIADAGGDVGAIDLVRVTKRHTVRDITVVIQLIRQRNLRHVGEFCRNELGKRTASRLTGNCADTGAPW